MWNIPNLLTFFRILLIPVFILYFYLPIENAHFVAACIFVFAAITDGLDGFLARKLNQFTRFGAFLDPVADKMMVAVSLIVVVEYHQSILVTIASIVIISRELIISALREWMAGIGKSESVAVSNLGKIKTTAQMVALTGLIWNANLFVKWTSIVLLYVAAVFTVWSMVLYLASAFSEIKNENESNKPKNKQTNK